MTRTIDAAVLRAFQARLSRRIHLLELQFSGGTVYFTTGVADVEWNGHTWVAIGGALAIGAVQETHDPDAQATELQLGGVDQSVIAVILSELSRGRQVNIWRAQRALADNLVPFSEDLTQWLLVNAPGVTTGVDDPLGGTRACTLTDSSATLVEDAFATVAYARDGVKELAVWLRQRGAGPGAIAQIELYDVTASAPVGWARLQFTNGIPVVTGMSASTTVLELTAAPADYYRLRFRTTGLLAAHTNRIGIVPAVTAADTAALDVFGAQVTDGGPAVHYQPTLGAAVHQLDVLGTPLLLFTGYLQEGFKLSESRPEDPQQPGTATITARIVSRVAGLHQVRGIRTNPTSHQMYYAGDTFFQHTAGLMYQPIYFGQKAPQGSRTD